jgi:adenylate kinase
MLYLLLLFLFSNQILGYKNFILIGQPGSGKGTLSSYLVEKAGYKHICPGDIIRTHLKNNTELGQKIRPGFERGEYVPDDILFRMIKEPIEECTAKAVPFIIDGFPRNDIGLEFLILLLQTKKIDAQVNFIHFQIDDETCIDRITNRIVCFNCYSIYNLITHKPKHSVICDKCSTRLEVRTGDTNEVVKRRLLHFHNVIEPMISIVKKDFQVIKFESKNNLINCIEFYDFLLNL